MLRYGAVKPFITVVGAVLEDERGVLCALRSELMSQPLVWEFPGGKVEPGESPAEALEREMREEFSCEIRVVGPPLEDVVWDSGERQVRLLTLPCRLAGGQPVPREHAAMLWLPRTALGSLVWAPADRPTVTSLLGGNLEE